jgi:hypothetical protein
VNVSSSFARSSVIRAVISFTVDPTDRRWRARRSQATSPVETSITIAFGALTASGQSRAWAGAAGRIVATAASATAAAPRAGLTGGASLAAPG